MEPTYSEFVMALAKPGTTIASELTPADIFALAIIGKLCKKSALVLTHIAENISTPVSKDEAHLWHMAIGMTGEAGELLDAYKKRGVYRKELDLVNVIEELGDFRFYLTGYKYGTNQEETEFDYLLEELYRLFNITEEEVEAHNRAKLAKRYESLTYSDQAAQARLDKVENTVTATGVYFDSSVQEHSEIMDEVTHSGSNN